MKRQDNSKQRTGSALVMVLFAIVILSVTGIGLLQVGLRGRVDAIRYTQRVQAQCAADAGLVKALYLMNQKVKVKPWSDVNLPVVNNEILPNADALYTYTVTGDTTNGYTIDCLGTSGPVQKHVISTLHLGGPFDFAVFGDEAIDLKNSAEISGYNFPSKNKVLKVGTNSTQKGAVDLKNSITIYGDVAVGAGGDPKIVINKGNSIKIKGKTYAMPEPAELTSVVVPSHIQALPSSGTLKKNATIKTSKKYDKINLGNSKKVTIEGQVEIYVVGDVILGNSVDFDISKSNNSSLTLYVGGKIEFKNSSNMNNNTQDPQRLKIYGLDTCTSVNLKNSSELYAAMYTPKADIVYHNSADIYGSVVGKTVEMKNSVKIYYDASLRNSGYNDQAVSFRVGRWKEQ